MASVAKLKSGKWAVRHVDRIGAHRQKTFAKKKDADAFRAKIENDKAGGLDQIAPSTVTVGRMTQEFLAARRRMHADGALSRGTLHREQHSLENYIERMLGKVPLQALTEVQVDQFIRDLRNTDRVSLPGRKLSPATVKQAARTLAQVIDFARRRKLLRENVAREVLSWPEHRSGPRATIRTFSADDVRRLLLSLETRRRWQMDRSVTLGRAMIYLAAFCGLRFGEVCGLTLDCIDFDRNVIEVRHSLDAWGTLKQPKTRAGIRDVPMAPPVASAVAEWIEAYHVRNRRGICFTTKVGEPMTKEPFHRDIWRPMLLEAGLGPDDGGERFHFHALRHFFASMMVQSQFALTDVANLMGHASFDMTLSTYAHPVIEASHRHVGVAKITSDLLDRDA